MRKLHIDLLGYINDMADKAYEDIDAVPREILLALMGAAALTAVGMTCGSEALLEEMVGEVDWLSIVGGPDDPAGGSPGARVGDGVGGQMDHEALLQKVSDGLDDLYADTSVSDGQLYEELTGLFDTIGDMLSELEDAMDQHPPVDEGDELPDAGEAQWAPRGP